MAYDEDRDMCIRTTRAVRLGLCRVGQHLRIHPFDFVIKQHTCLRKPLARIVPVNIIATVCAAFVAVNQQAFHTHIALRSLGRRY